MSETEIPGQAPEKKEDEIADYFKGVNDLEMKSHEGGIKKARNALYVTAGLLLVGELITANATGLTLTPLAIAIIAFEVGIFVALALWTKTKPYAAIVTGLILFIALWIISIIIAANAGLPVYSGVVVKIIIISFLISALKPAKAWEEAKKNVF